MAEFLDDFGVPLFRNPQQICIKLHVYISPSLPRSLCQHANMRLIPLKAMLPQVYIYIYVEMYVNMIV